MSARNPKYLNKVMLTKQKLGDHEYTVMYDREGNKYLKLETFELKTPEPKLDFDVAPTTGFGDFYISKAFWGFDAKATRVGSPIDSVANDTPKRELAQPSPEKEK